MACPTNTSQSEIDPDHKLSTRELILKVMPGGAEWIKTPNTKFLGRAPEELIGTSEEAALRNLVFNVKDGCFS